MHKALIAYVKELFRDPDLETIALGLCLVAQRSQDWTRGQQGAEWPVPGRSGAQCWAVGEWEHGPGIAQCGQRSAAVGKNDSPEALEWVLE
jgi:hypothetical protein